ncbi:MAG: ATP-binding protein [Candidatus Eisenbacteria bacterium]
MSPRLRAYVYGMIALGAAALATHIPTTLDADWGHYVAWLVICLVSETMWSTTLTGDSTWSLSSTAGLCVLVLWGPAVGMWVTSVSTVVADLFVVRKPGIRAWFNGGQTAITALCAGLAFELLGGRNALPVNAGTPVLHRDAAASLVLPFVGLVVTYFVVNRSLVTVAVAWSSGRTWLRAMREDWLHFGRLEMDGAAYLLVPLMVISYVAIGYPGVLLFYAPLFMLHQSGQRYIQLRRAQEQNLRNARFAAKGELAAGIGHELNNQLVAITARAQMLLKDAERQKFDNAPRHAQIILEQSKRMGVLAKGLMDYTRNQVNLEPLDLNGLLVSTIEFVKGDKRFRSVEWEVELDPELPELRGDVGQIQGVFINLFVNAADAMSSQESRRAIRVVTRHAAGAKSARVDVSDTGPGIKSEHLSRMFEFMFTTKPDGHGFGLSTAHRTIENHGGRITVDSPPGAGARFHIVLPLRGPGGWN